MVSYDIETAMQGLQLYCIAVHGVCGSEQTAAYSWWGRALPRTLFPPIQSQEEVLQAFLDWVAEYDPDVLIGWNVVNFDTWYLQRLSDKLGRRLLLGRDRRPAHWRELDDDGERRAVQLPGRVVLDGIELLRAAFYRFESFSLENVSRQLLGEGKLLHGQGRGDEISHLFSTTKAAWQTTTCATASWSRKSLRIQISWISPWHAVP